MIEASDFIDHAAALGYDYYAGVSSTQTAPLINTVIDSDRARYISIANEGDAVALAAGHALAGRRAVAMMSTAGLGNAVSPLTALTWVFRLPILLIVGCQDASSADDDTTPDLMGEIAPGLLETLEVPWAFFPEAPTEVEPTLARAEAHMQDTGRPYCLLVKQDAVAPAALYDRTPPSQSRGAITYRPASRKARDKPGLSRRDALAYLLESTGRENTVLISSPGLASRELYALADRPNHFYTFGATGCAPLLALGLATARPDLRVIVIDGDGAALTRLGGMATLAAYGPTNLCHLLLDNGIYESSGGQPTVSNGLSFGAIAAACGYRTTYEGYERTVIDEMLAGSSRGPAFAHVHIEAGIGPDELPALDLTPTAIRQRLTRYLETTAS